MGIGMKKTVDENLFHHQISAPAGYYPGITARIFQSLEIICLNAVNVFKDQDTLTTEFRINPGNMDGFISLKLAAETLNIGQLDGKINFT